MNILNVYVVRTDDACDVWVNGKSIHWDGSHIKTINIEELLSTIFVGETEVNVESIYFENIDRHYLEYRDLKESYGVSEFKDLEGGDWEKWKKVAQEYPAQAM